MKSNSLTLEWHQCKMAQTFVRHLEIKISVKTKAEQRASVSPRTRKTTNHSFTMETMHILRDPLMSTGTVTGRDGGLKWDGE